MATDILCGPPEHPDFAIVQAPVLKVEGQDFMLDSAERRKSPTPPFRRALVHDQNDGLTLNFNSDYPGGVTINGERLLVNGGINFVMRGDPNLELAARERSLEQIVNALNAEIGILQGWVSNLNGRVANLEAPQP